VFWLCVNRLDEERGRVWALVQGGRWLVGRRIDVAGVALETVFRGRTARQPRAFLRGRGVVRRRGEVLEVRSS
jgi:hypothetical protein